MNKIKIIYADYDDLQESVNDWLDENPSVEVVSTSLSNTNGGYTNVISIVYEEKGEFRLNS